jgi:hypothetical protein
MRSLHDVHEMNAYKADCACLSVRMIKLENRWMYLDEILYVRCATGSTLKSYFLMPHNR